MDAKLAILRAFRIAPTETIIVYNLATILYRLGARQLDNGKGNLTMILSAVNELTLAKKYLKVLSVKGINSKNKCDLNDCLVEFRNCEDLLRKAHYEEKLVRNKMAEESLTWKLKQLEEQKSMGRDDNNTVTDPMKHFIENGVISFICKNPRKRKNKNDTGDNKGKWRKKQEAEQRPIPEPKPKLIRRVVAKHLKCVSSDSEMEHQKAEVKHEDNGTKDTIPGQADDSEVNNVHPSPKRSRGTKEKIPRPSKDSASKHVHPAPKRSRGTKEKIPRSSYDSASKHVHPPPKRSRGAKEKIPGTSKDTEPKYSHPPPRSSLRSWTKWFNEFCNSTMES